MVHNYTHRNSTGITTVSAFVVSSAGAGDAGKGIGLGTDGLIDPSNFPPGVGAMTATATATENLTAGDFINLYDVTGTPSARQADATTSGKPVHGFVLADVTSGNPATVYLSGVNTQLTGLTTGVRYFLSTTPGAVSATPAQATGNLDQCVGVATSATTIALDTEDGIVW